MSTPVLTPTTLDLSATPQVSTARLAKVEFRKSLDTRAGRWLAGIIIGLVLIAVIGWALLGPDSQKDLMDFLSVAGGALGYFMPILIIMLVTSESSQRNGLVTFTLEPRRSRIVAAKLLAGLLLAACVMLVGAVLAVFGTMLGSVAGASPDWALDGQLAFNGFVLANAIGVLVGFAISTVLMNTPAAIVVYFAYTFVLPVVLGILSEVSEGVEKVAPWIDFNTAQLPFFEGDYVPNGEEWAQFALTGTIWLVIPLVIGVWRLLRIEFK